MHKSGIEIFLFFRLVKQREGIQIIQDFLKHKAKIAQVAFIVLKKFYNKGQGFF